MSETRSATVIWHQQHPRGGLPISLHWKKLNNMELSNFIEILVRVKRKQYYAVWILRQYLLINGRQGFGGIDENSCLFSTNEPVKLHLNGVAD